MKKNYKISQHPYLHATRCTMRVTGKMGRAAWREFIKPASVIACGIILGMPLAMMIGTAIGYAWR